MKKIKTESGFECEVRDDAMNDMRILDALVQVESKKTEASKKVVELTKILNALLGEDQKEALYDFVAEKEGQARAEEVFKLLREIFTAISESKKN